MKRAQLLAHLAPLAGNEFASRMKNRLGRLSETNLQRFRQATRAGIRDLDDKEAPATELFGIFMDPVAALDYNRKILMMPRLFQHIRIC